MNERLKELRKALGLTQSEFASRIGSVQNTITGYESGKRTPSNPVIAAICKEFGVSKEWLLSGVGEMFDQAGDELDALVKKHNCSAAVRALLKKVIELPPNCQDLLTNFLVDYAATIQEMQDAGIDPRMEAAQEEPRELTIDEKVAAYRRMLEEEEALNRASREADGSGQGADQEADQEPDQQAGQKPGAKKSSA